MRIGSCLLALSLVGCSSGGLSDSTFATGSTTVVSSSAARAVYAVNTEEGTVSRYDSATGAVSSVDVGAEPTRIARVGDRLLVTLRGERGIAVVRDVGGSLVRESVVPTGAEPYGIVASEDGTHVYVALSTQDEVDELDGSTLSVVRTWHVDGQPRWLALHPSDRALFVGSAFGGNVARIDLDELDNVRSLDLPSTTGPSGDFTRRITGDLSISSDGLALAIPALFVDNTTPVDGDPNVDGSIDGTSGGYGSAGLGVSRLNPAIILVDLTAGSGSASDPGTPILFAGAVTRSATGMQDLVRSYPASATFAPDGGTVWATLEGSAAVAVLSTVPMHLDQAPGPTPFFGDTGASQAGFSVANTVFIGTDEGPRGVAFTGDQDAFVHAFMDRTVAPIKTGRAIQDLQQSQQSGSAMMGGVMDSWQLAPGVELTPSKLAPELEHGRHLFYSATDSAMAGAGAGVSCATCHFDRRNDGVTWTLPGGPRNTPSLVGRVSETAPVTWTDEVPTIADEVRLTSQGRMGGFGLTDYDAATVSLYIDSNPLPDLPSQDESAVARGRAIYERADVGCATCHGGATLTDGTRHAVFDNKLINTPTLRGVAASGPYFHDGSAATLEDVLATSDARVMGDTSMLTDAQRADLIVYLRSL